MSDVNPDASTGRRAGPGYLKPYREAIARLGPGFEATLWRDKAAQTLRFEAALSLMEVSGRRVADLGCGPGDLVSYLESRDIQPSAILGIDAQPEMVELAQTTHPAATFKTADLAIDLSVLRAWQPEVCLISGMLNTMTQRQAWSLVMAVHECASIGVVFNFLSNRPHPRFSHKNLKPARRFHTARWVDRCLRVTPCVSFRQDYLDGHDATIALRHVTD